MSSRAKQPDLNKTTAHVKEFRTSQKRIGSRWLNIAFPDIWLVLCWMSLIVIGMIMVTSASMSEATHAHLSVWYYAMRQGIFYVIGLLAAYIVFSMNTNTYYKYSAHLLILAFVLMLALHIPGVGVSVNGSRRWINLYFVNLQVGEIVKVAMIIFTAAYLKKESAKLSHSWQPIFVMLLVMGLFAGLLLLQPDFGTTAVMCATVLGIMFLSGVSLTRFLILGAVVAVVMGLLMVAKSYRVERLMTFMHPWDHQYDEGYQLVNSLISFGRGGIFGLGIGDSVQKHQYLPEAHTDFIFSIISEETGLLGALIVLGIFVLLVWRAFVIARLADSVRMRFASNMAYGIGLWIAIQVIINIGVTTGALPTKGLTLPLVSYGGSSVVMTCIAMALLARVDAEARFQAKREGKL